MFRTHSLPFDHDHALPPPPPSSASSPSFQMPTVLVHPPEEEQDEAMPWCAFDANQETTQPGAAFSTPEMEELRSKLDVWSETVRPTAEHAPTFHRAQADSDVIMPRRGSSSNPSLSGRVNPLGLATIPESPKRPKERDDEDIVEVMKVRRGEGMLDVTYAHGTVPALRRSKTLRSRAAQALRSIKNVGKVPRKPTAEHVFPAKENGHPPKSPTPVHAPATATGDKRAKSLSTHPSAPRLKKRMSQPLSNLFGLGLSTPTAAQNTSDVIGVEASLSHSGRFRTMPYAFKGSASASALNLSTDEPARPTSPTFSIRGTRHKFSFVNLQSIFPGNSTGTSEPEPEPQPVAANPELDEPALSRTVQTPVDEWDSGEDYDSPRRHANLGTMYRPSDESSYPEQEISFETRLNSLHFDSFSFDADAF
jgi:hypothetical protein